MAEDNKKRGVNAAVEEAAGARAAPARPRQLALLPLDASEAAPEARVPGRRGRPPGAKNRSTEQVRVWLARRGADPLAALQDTIGMTVDDLAKRLECSKKDAYAIQMDAAKALAPYMHGKPPVAVQVEGKGEMRLVLDFGIGADQAPAEGEEAGYVVIEGELEGESENGGKSEG